MFWLKPSLELETFLKQLRRINCCQGVVLQEIACGHFHNISLSTDHKAYPKKWLLDWRCWWWWETKCLEGLYNMNHGVVGRALFFLIAWACPQETRNLVEEEMWIIDVDNYRWVKSGPEAASVVLCFGLNLRCFQTPQLWQINMPTICMFSIINTWMYDGRITLPTRSETTRWTFTETWDQLEKEIRQPQVTAIILVARVLNHEPWTA